MFKHTSKRDVSSEDLANYIESFDVYNARLMDGIRDAYNDRVTYEVRTFEYRPDLIAKDIYGNTKYTGIFMISCGVGLEGLYKGAVLQVIPKEIIDRILSNLAI